MAGMLGRKLGMTQVFDSEDGHVERVTVLEAGPCFVTAIRRADRDGYDAVQLAFGPGREKGLQKARLGHLQKAGVGPLRHLAEFRGEPGSFRHAGEGEEEPGELEIGNELKVDGVFERGQRVKVSGRSKGKGFAGTIKRHNFHRGPVTHGSHNVRAPGSIGASADPSRVFKGIRGPGQMGNKRVTQRGLEVVDVRPEENLLLVRGSVPGPANGVVEIRVEG
jgi:large subunit ribosomal protein L3